MAFRFHVNPEWNAFRSAFGTECKDAQKRQVVAETHQPGGSVPMIAQHYNLNAKQVFRWRCVFLEPERAGRNGWFVPLVVEAAPSQEPDAATMSSPAESVVARGKPATGRMKTVLPCDRRVSRSHGRRNGAVTRDFDPGAAIILVPSRVRVWLAIGETHPPPLRRSPGLATDPSMH